jgi:ubiquinone/menaquinone biosynthesis C-methylase UbiE
MHLTLLPQALLVRTGPVDHAAWNYSGLLGVIQRRRFWLVLRLLSSRSFKSVLEVGYGSGVFLPELAKRCSELYGIDIHSCDREVTAALSKEGVRATLKSGSATAMPFPDASFDCVVAVSALEFVDDLDTACAEIARVLRPDGTLVVVTPSHSVLLDLGLCFLTGQSAKTDFGDRRTKVEPALQRHFKVLRCLHFPPFVPAAGCVYRCFLLRRL